MVSVRTVEVLGAKRCGNRLDPQAEVVFLPGGHKKSPLPTSLTSRAGISRSSVSVAVPSNAGSIKKDYASQTLVSQNCQCHETSSRVPIKFYIGENFSVRYNEYFKLVQLIQNECSSGLIVTDFQAFRNTDTMSLSQSAQKIRDVPNAGGNSVVSEVLSFELFSRCFGARLLKTEMEVTYFPEGGSITDYMCSLFDTTLGVSVTRAMKYGGPFTQEDGVRLLNKKLSGVLQSSQNSMDQWNKQVLHVWATSDDVANVLVTTYSSLNHHVRANTVVIVTVAHNAQDIFSNTKRQRK